MGIISLPVLTRHYCKFKMIIALKLEAKLTVRAALRGFWSRIDFHQTEAVCESAGRQAAGARCQDVCSYFPLSKIRAWTFSSVTQRYSTI